MLLTTDSTLVMIIMMERAQHVHILERGKSRSTLNGEVRADREGWTALSALTLGLQKEGEEMNKGRKMMESGRQFLTLKEGGEMGEEMKDERVYLVNKQSVSEKEKERRWRRRVKKARSQNNPKGRRRGGSEKNGFSGTL